MSGDVPRLGVVGLGRMGSAAARRLIEGGYPVAVWNRSADKAEALAADGARPCGTVAELAASSDIVILFLTDAAAVEAVALDDGGMLAKASSGLTVVNMSTVSPDDSRRLARAGALRGIEVLDAPVAGGPPLMRKGQVGVMVGGAATAFERCRPIFETLGRLVVHVGASGQGSALKLVNNLVLAVSIQGTAEALVLAERLGLDPQHLFAVAATGGAQTRAMEVRGPRMVARDFAPVGALDDLHKDLSAALALADAGGVALPAAKGVLDTLVKARAMGWGASDSSALFAALESLAAKKASGEG